MPLGVISLGIRVNLLQLLSVESPLQHCILNHALLPIFPAVYLQAASMTECKTSNLE